ncbi:prepilin-type cleavage/methylation domain-containing protein [Photobacterium frigidiphilum]|uniref:Pilin n=1 Tax=Photobacterium frigidiphilum TaxID=264736 RepID=A0A2T3JDY3_9GAMM|nr:pilin [Photobacterium frigidiphilum]PSU47084.1 prepilin-type cleavage/methylation domain-containing protein [Photobacterium frigidiphilum]
MKKMQKGFTLIELMIVVAVIGVLTAIAVPQYQNYVKKSTLGVGLANIAALKTNIEDYVATESSFPVTTAADAPSFARLGTVEDLGEGKVSTKAGTTAGEGEIRFTFDAGPVSGEKIRLSRDVNGLWKCDTSAEAAIAPRGCTPDITIT